MNQTEQTFPRPDEPQPRVERPSPIPGVTWGWRDIVLGVVLAMVTFFILGATVVGTSTAIFGEDALETLLAEAAAIAILDVVLIAAVLTVVRRKGAGFSELGLKVPQFAWPKMLGYIALAYLAAIGLVNIYGIAINAFGLDQLKPGQQLEDNFYDHDAVVILTGLAIVFMAPVAEEIFFRGFIFGGLRRYLNLPIAGLISGCLFALAHGDPGLILPFSGVGLVLAYVYERSGTLWASIGVHFVFNSISFILLLTIPEWR